MCAPLWEVPVRSWGHRFGGQKRAPEPGLLLWLHSQAHMWVASTDAWEAASHCWFARFRLELDEICGSVGHLVEGTLENSLRQPDDEASGCFLPRDNLCLQKIMQRRNDKGL